MSTVVNPSSRIYAFPVLAVLIWSVNTIVNKLAAGRIDPAAISFYRWAVALCLLTPVMLPAVWRNRAVIRPLIGKLMVLGLLGMVAYQSLAYFAAHATSATNMGLIAALIPLLTQLQGRLIAKDKLTATTLAGAAVSLSGLVWLLSSGDPVKLLAGEFGRGDALMLLASLSYGTYSVLLRKWALPLPVWQSLYMQIFFSVLMLLPGYLHAAPSPLNAGNIPLILFAGIFASTIAPFLWMRGVAQLGAGRTALFMNLLPVFTVIIAVSMLGEAVHPYHLVGGLLVLGGVWLGQVKRG
ncbi:DMT family transporter [Burkholderiaceae bacterium DAT-1]|nr:DMT family transporter [Burkholderiaceae bacterium DAT-1]